MLWINPLQKMPYLFTFAVMNSLHIEPIFITGINGFLGKHIAQHFSNQQIPFIGSGSKPTSYLPNYVYADLSKHTFSNVLYQLKPKVIIHNGALSKPDECFKHPDLCTAINYESTKQIVDYCKTNQAFLVFMSTDFVLGNGGPHHEEADYNPLNNYGHSKMLAELYIKQHLEQYSIVRPVFIYGKSLHGTNCFIQNMIKKIEQGLPVSIVDDQLRTPTFATDICKALVELIDKKITGTFHLSGDEIITPKEMIVQACNYLKLNSELVQGISTMDLKELVQRPTTGGLLNHKAKQVLGFKPLSFTDALPLCF